MLAERRHQPSVSIGDGDEDADDVAAAAEGRLLSGGLLSGRGRDRKTDRDKPGSKTSHRTIPQGPAGGVLLISQRASAVRLVAPAGRDR